LFNNFSTVTFSPLDDEIRNQTKVKQIPLIFVLRDADSHALLKKEMADFQADYFKLQPVKFSDVLFYAECSTGFKWRTDGNFE